MKISKLSMIKPITKINMAKSSAVSSPMNVQRADMVSFSGKYETKPVNVDIETAKFVANSLSTSTSGHRAPYGSDKFNKDVVELITVGVGKYAIDHAKAEGKKPTVLIGGDTRVATKESLPLIKDTLLKQGVDVLYIEKPVPTPTLAVAARDNNVDLAVLMTASHNPWADGGYNLVTKEGAIAPASVTKKVAEKMVETAEAGSYTVETNPKSEVKTIFPYEEYKKQIDSLGLIDWENIRKNAPMVYYDPLEGTGANVLPQLLEDNGVRYTVFNSKGHEGPNPNASNLKDMGEYLADKADAGFYNNIGLATDGDADRFGLVDERGNFIPANDVILLSAYHLAKNKGLTGAIIRSQATSSQVDEVAKKYDQKLFETPVGFKYIAEDIIELREHGEEVLVAGEESGGMTAYGHIPEKDGILANLLVLDLVAVEKKPVSEILADVKKELGVKVHSSIYSKKMKADKDKAVVMDSVGEYFKQAVAGKYADVDVEATKKNAEDMKRYREGGDGYKIIYKDGSSLLFRKSGTEPLVKCYIEARGGIYGTLAERHESLERKAKDFFPIG